MSFRAGRLRCEHSCRRLQPNGRKPGAGGWCATVRPAVIARSCCSWENRPRSPSCCFTFRIKSQGLARPATEQGSKAASVSLSAPRGSISPELSVLARPPGEKTVRITQSLSSQEREKMLCRCPAPCQEATSSCTHREPQPTAVCRQDHLLKSVLSLTLSLFLRRFSYYPSKWLYIPRLLT